MLSLITLILHCQYLCPWTCQKTAL